MPTLGSDGGFQADNRGGIIDAQGNTIVTADTTFAASPLGIAARTQALYGLANANFNLTPPNPGSAIVANQNDLPYWAIEDLSDGLITATTVFDGTTQTWGVQIDPGTAATGSSLALTTRSYLITDDNLALRQKAFAVLSKSGTAAGTTQWNLQLSAVYYDSTDTALSTAIIGTALDTGTWTSFAGTTTPGGSAINAAAQYVDLTFTLTTTAAVTGSAKATIKSLLLSTRSSVMGAFQVVEAFTSSGTWTKPAGVDYVSVIATGGGGGGASGCLVHNTTGGGDVSGGGGGGGARMCYLQDIYVGDVASVSVGVGAGGSGGTARTYSKAAGVAGTVQALSGVNGSAGGASSFGAYLVVNGGGPGLAGTVATSGAGGAGGTAAGASTGNTFGRTDTAGSAGGAGGQGGSGNSGVTGGTVAVLVGITQLPFTSATYYTSAGTGSVGTASFTGGTAVAGTAGIAGSAGWSGGGGGGAGGKNQSSGWASTGGSGGGGGGAGAGLARFWTTPATTGVYTVTLNAGDGGTAGQYSGAGGGAGGISSIYWNLTSQAWGSATISQASGVGGAGGGGFVLVAYTA